MDITNMPFSSNLWSSQTICHPRPISDHFWHQCDQQNPLPTSALGASSLKPQHGLTKWTDYKSEIWFNNIPKNFDLWSYFVLVKYWSCCQGTVAVCMSASFCSQYCQSATDSQWFYLNDYHCLLPVCDDIDKLGNVHPLIQAGHFFHSIISQR